MLQSQGAVALNRPLRSALYIPGANERALEKAKMLACDAISFDLDDAVAPVMKPCARRTLVGALRAQGYGPRMKIVRINGLETAWGADDLAALAGLDVDAVLLPKVESAQMLDDLAGACPDVALWAMIETPLGVLNAAQVAAHPRLTGMVMGTNDLAKDLNTRDRADRLPLLTGLQYALLAAKAHGVMILDGVYNAFKDIEGLSRECEQGRDMGFDGKTLIHPAQLDVANAAFTPTADEIDLATRQIEAFEGAVKDGSGIAVLDGKIVEILHVATARATLEKARMIDTLA
jgi:(3S)-malyl-CoA thioesterase